MPNTSPALSAAQIEQFVTDGFVRLDNAFPEDVAAECRRILWADTGCDPGNPASWTRPVIRLGNYTQPPFIVAANTRIRVGSYFDIARQLAPAADAGLTLRELAADNFAGSAHRPEVLATGSPGTVYLCHPFLVHAAQPHRGTRPRIMAQPPLLPRTPLELERVDGTYSPVEHAIRIALGG